MNEEQLETPPAASPEDTAPIDQTIFAVQEPILEGVAPAPSDPHAQTPPPSRARYAVAGSVLVVLCFVAVAAWWLWPQPAPEAPVVVNTPAPEATPLPESDLKTSITVYDAQLKTADPARLDVLYPTAQEVILLGADEW